MKRLFPILLSLWTLVAFGADPTINGANIRAATLPITAIAPQPANTTLCNATGSSAVPTACDAATMRTNIGAGTGTGDASTNTATSVDGEITLFSSTTGKILKRATGTGLAKVTSGVFSTATAGTDYYNPGGADVALADGGTGASLADPNADRILFWDDSAGAVTWLTAGTGLTITGTTIDATGGGGLTNFTDGISTSAPNATTPVASLTATNAASHVDAAFVAKGAGATAAQISDGTAAGGNKRGNYATDWQKIRGAAADAATASYTTIGGGHSNKNSGDYGTVGGGNSNVNSGLYGTIPGGQSNTVSSNYGSAMGRSNSVTAQYATALGLSNTASGTAAVSLGNSNTADGEYSQARGSEAAARGIYGADSYASGKEASVGDAQTRKFVLHERTTNATPAVLTTNSSSAGTTNQIVLPNNSLFSFFGQCTAREAATGDSKSIKFEGSIKRGANAAATALQGSVTQADLGTPDAGATWTFAFTADTSNGALAVTFTGEASHNLQEVCTVYTTENVY